MEKSRLERIEATTLTSVTVEGSHRILSEDDYQFLLQNAKNHIRGIKDRALIRQILGND